ncbi:MAG: copper resistance CopC family protein [Chthoniobacterales bacterium]
MRRLFLVVLGLLAWFATESAPGHSTLTRSEPGNRTTLKQAPDEIRIWFTEPIKVGLSTIEVRNASGKQVDQRDLRADGKDPTLVHLSLPAGLKPDTYQVSWIAVADDLHVSKGSFSFRIAP